MRNSKAYLILTTAVVILFFLSCKNDVSRDPGAQISGPLFSQLPVSSTGINFQNTIQESPEFNFLFYGYMYNGGGVAAGDINNDGLTDLYFTANQGSNKLYLNKGKFEFEDITDKAGVADNDGWTTGVSMVDINSDGYLDIYVCKSGSTKNPALRRNKLFINNGDASFTESAQQYGLADAAYSTQAYFLDIDNDEDLDMYLVNHRPDFNNNSKINSEIQRAVSMESSDQLYRNDNGKFSNITQAAGLLNKTWGLSAAIADYNKDGYPDIYVCNDFLEPDHLYINQKNGTFKNEILNYMKHISFYSMGSDIADINNDGELDLIVLDMVSENHVRSKRNMASMSNSVFRTMVNIGYHHQYMANMLQLNNGNGTFSEIGHLAGVAKTDWSWAPLLADFDNDGYKDLFVTNGIKRDVTDNDYKIELRKRNEEGVSMSLDEIFNLMPSSKQKNYAFRNNGNLGFEKVAKDWGVDQELHSNGAAYADLDNDGDLDLILNNVDEYASVYENNCNKNFIQLKLAGGGKNASGLGATIKIKGSQQTQIQQAYYNRGFQSSVDHRLHFGVGEDDKVDIEIIWSDGKVSTVTDVKTNQLINISHDGSNTGSIPPHQGIQKLFASINSNNLGIDFQHKENDYDDFIDEILLPQKQSTHGPAIAVADVNGDGNDDFYIGGAKSFEGALFIQSQNGFNRSSQLLFATESKYEDSGALFFDADNDGDQDLYVASGGNEVAENDPLLQHRLYTNDGSGNFTKNENTLPSIRTSGMAVQASDIDADGDLDLFVGGRLVPGKYPFPADSYILRNDDGKFTDVTAQSAPGLNKIGLVTDAIFADYDNDSDEDLILVGEWMPLSIFVNDSGNFSPLESPGFDKSNGWWYSIEKGDFDKDGDIDFVVGNLGLNNKFGASQKKPFHVYCADFDDSGNYDIVLSKEGKDKMLPLRGRECSSQQMPFIKDKFPSYKLFAEAGLEDIYGEKLSNALHYKTFTFASSYLQNNGDGSFTLSELNREAQFGPTLGIEIIDINKDGNLDIVAVGNIFDAEVETLRYDASRGYILLGDGKGGFQANLKSGFYNDFNAKNIKHLKIGTDNVFVVANNNGPLQFLKQL
jgi:hypothetical protein